MSADRTLPCLAVRSLVRLGLTLCLLSALALVWEVLTLQMPNSPFHVGVLSGPVAQLRTLSGGLGLGCLALAWLWPQLFSAQEGRLALALLCLGTALHVLTLLYAASQGMVGVQLLDPRLDARLVVYTRGLSHALLLAGFLPVWLRALRWRSRGPETGA